MEFRLTYRGPLKGNAVTVEDKQRLRRSFHPQLKQLWNLEPLKSREDLLMEQTVTVSVIFDRAGFKFAPLITEDIEKVTDCGTPGSTDSWLRNHSLLFIPHRTHIVESLVQPLAIIKHLDVIEDGGTRLITMPEVVMPGELILEI